MSLPPSNRTSDHPIHAQFLERWSPRAFDPRPIDEPVLLSLIEAARFAPSASNLQPWRYVYALRDTPRFDELLSCLVPFNQDWAKNASALLFLAGVKAYDADRPLRHSDFDAGASWMALALEAHHQGLISHAMGGVEFEKAHQVLGLHEDLSLICAIAVGFAGNADTLPPHLKEREAASGRLSLEKIAFKDRYDGTKPSL